MVEKAHENTDSKEARHRVFWVGLICALLSGQVLLMFVAVYLTVADGSFAVEPNYYQKSLNWDATVAQLRENQRLGWQSQLQVGDEADVYKHRHLTCRLVNAQGDPLDGAMIDVVAFPHARGSDRQSSAMKPIGDGYYETTLRFARQGKWEFRLAVQRGPETFTHTEVTDVYPPGESL
jgi:nitrogen fixation protein FixH